MKFFCGISQKSNSIINQNKLESAMVKSKIVSINWNQNTNKLREIGRKLSKPDWNVYNFIKSKTPHVVKKKHWMHELSKVICRTQWFWKKSRNLKVMIKAKKTMSQIKKKGLFWARNALLRFPKHGGIIFWGLYFNIASKKIISSHKKNRSNCTKKRLLTVIYLCHSVKNSWKAIHWTQHMIEKFSQSEKIRSHSTYTHFRF